MKPLQWPRRAAWTPAAPAPLPVVRADGDLLWLAAVKLLRHFPTARKAVDVATDFIATDPALRSTRGDLFFQAHPKLAAALADRGALIDLMLKLVRLRQDAPVTLDLELARVHPAGWPA